MTELRDAIDYFEQEWNLNGRGPLWHAGQAMKSRPVMLDAARKWADFLDDPVAAVRRGVESGTIKGEVVEVSTMKMDGGVPIQTPIMVKPGRYLVIPVSDGGSET